jgi:putative copper export protein
MSASFSIDTFRIFLHVLAVTVWLGGQIVMLSLLPVLREAGVEGLPAKAARAFQRVAWPAFGVAFITGMWNLFEVDMDNAETSWNVVFGIKFLLVLISGAAAWVHASSSKPAIKGMTGAVGFIAALAAFILGYAISGH